MNQFMEPRSIVIGKESRLLIVFFAFSASVRLSLIFLFSLSLVFLFSLSHLSVLSLSLIQLPFSRFSYLLLPFPSSLKNFSKLLVSQSNFPPLTSSFLFLSRFLTDFIICPFLEVLLNFLFQVLEKQEVRRGGKGETEQRRRRRR